MRASSVTPQQRRELAAAAIVPEKTIRRAYADPGRARAATIERISRAARVLGLPLPGEVVESAA